MALQFHPRRGCVLMCDFSGFKPPEMVKTRPVVVLSGERIGVCTVVPLSATAPHPVKPWHHLLSAESLPESLRDEPAWAKCDMVTTVSLERLDRVKNGRDGNGKRIYVAKLISREDLTAIETCVIRSLCMMHRMKVEEKRDLA